MSTSNRILVGFCLSVAFASPGVHVRAQSAADQPSQREAPPPAQAGDDRERYLLLTNGQLLPGIVSETDTEYLLEQPVGTMRFPKKRVEGSFDSVRQAYEHRLSQLPERDSDEQMKLALWCLHLNLIAEAQELLKSVIKLNPKNTEASARLVSIKQAAARVARRERDPDVRQTKADGTANGRPEALDQTKAGGMVSGRPEALDAAVLRSAKRGLGVTDLPVIFDLPVPLAIKRTEEFTRYVHPLLQKRCANCHDGEYPGEFQLVPIKSRADRTADALRANLDATLRLIDPKNPLHSLLLSSTLRPHGNGTKPRPIFPGSNDPAYKVLAEWTTRLVAPKEADESARCASAPAAAATDEVFAADRNRGSAVSRPKGAAATATAMPSSPRFNPPMPAGPAVGQNSSAPEEFPIPFAISGVRPKLAPSPKAGEAPAKRPAAAPAAKPAAPCASTKPAAIPDDDDDDDDNLPSTPQAKTATATAKKPAKPLAIDPKLLERALQNRNASRPNAGSN